MRVRKPVYFRNFLYILTFAQPPPPPPPNWLKMMTATTVGILAAEWVTDETTKSPHIDTPVFAQKVNG
jgi:hypothetical protein